MESVGSLHAKRLVHDAHYQQEMGMPRGVLAHRGKQHAHDSGAEDRQKDSQDQQGHPVRVRPWRTRSPLRHGPVGADNDDTQEDQVAAYPQNPAGQKRGLPLPTQQLAVYHRNPDSQGDADTRPLPVMQVPDKLTRKPLSPCPCFPQLAILRLTLRPAVAPPWRRANACTPWLMVS